MDLHFAAALFFIGGVIGITLGGGTAMGTDQGAVESIPWKTLCFTGKEMRREEKYLVPETEYALYVNGMHYCQWMCSPWDLEDLAWGTLYGKGEIRFLWVNEKEQRVEVEMSGVMKDAKNNKIKETTKETAEEMEEGAADERWETHISPEQVIALSSALDQASRGFRRTGGVHMAALGDDGKLLLIREDVGRHNAMEKLMGPSKGRSKGKMHCVQRKGGGGDSGKGSALRRFHRHCRICPHQQGMPAGRGKRDIADRLCKGGFL